MSFILGEVRRSSRSGLQVYYCLPFSSFLGGRLSIKKMRVLYIIAIVLGHFTALGQVDSLGLNSNPLLTKAEADYLNGKFTKERGQFDFEDKRIVFVTGSTGSMLMTKPRYFSDVKLWIRDNDEVMSSLYILTKEEKRSSGYDAIVTAWVKILTDKRRDKVVRQLKGSR